MNNTLKRADQFLDILKRMIYRNVVNITDVEISDSRDGSAEWKAFPVGGYWGKHDTWYRFRTEFIIPETFAGHRVGMRLVTGREERWNSLNPQFLVSVNGVVQQALDTNHHVVELTMKAQAGDRFAVEFEAYAGREEFNELFRDHPLQFRLSAHCHDALSEAVYYDLLAAKKAAELWPETDYRRIQIEEHLTKALNLLDCRVPGSEDYENSLLLAREYMQKEFYEKFCGHDEVIANCIGHTHIDVAWRWCLGQTRAKAVRSFSTELELMKEYPEHYFTSSQPQLYQYVKEDCPEIYEQIKQRVAEGRWEVEGAMWLEADCNLSSGESLIRQILHGKRFMKEEFGVDSKVLWLPDVFGYSAALPQILNKSGVDTFITSKIHWNDTNHLPYDTFLWKGVDGTEIFTHFITGGPENAKLGDGQFYSTYVGKITPICAAKGWEIYQQKNINNEMLLTFGFGDGGGGVTREMLEMNRRMSRGIPGTPKTRITTVADALDRIRTQVEGKKLPKWVGELYLEFHRGTYTSVAKNKWYNRKSEFLLQSVEAASVTNKLLASGDYAKKEIYDSWDVVLLNQFHDIIPGSSIREVYEESEAQYLQLLDENGKRMDGAVAALAAASSQAGIFVYNPAGTTQSGVVECGGVKYYAKDVPAFGWKVVEKKHCAGPKLEISTTRMENDFFSLKLDEKGTFVSIYDKVNNREVLQAGQRGNVLQAFDDHPFVYDNWEISNYYEEKMWEIDDVSDIRVVEVDDVQASLKITRRFLSSTIEQVITIYRDIPRIDFDVNADWHEKHILVKTAFPVDVLSDKATYEIQYGAVERPAHINTSWDQAKFEVCAQKWIDFAEADYGVALMNDCKYGHDVHDGVMRMSLWKCGTFPNEVADQGHHQLRYSLMPHAGSWREAKISNEAYGFNCPLVAVETAGTGTLAPVYALVSSNQDNILITVVKEACDSEDIIIRAYESQGRRTNVEISCGFAVAEAAEVDMMEQQVWEELAVRGNTFATNFKPFEIKTFRIKK